MNFEESNVDLFGITVKRRPINYVGPQPEGKAPQEKTPKPPKKEKAYSPPKVKVEKPKKQKLTEEQIKKRKAERALHWYNERKHDEALLERRRAYAREYIAAKKDK